MVAIADLKSAAARRTGSSPVSRTKCWGLVKWYNIGF